MTILYKNYPVDYIIIFFTAVSIDLFIGLKILIISYFYSLLSSQLIKAYFELINSCLYHYFLTYRIG